jgi:hypothetical protein
MVGEWQLRRIATDGVPGSRSTRDRERLGHVDRDERQLDAPLLSELPGASRDIADAATDVE